MLRQTLIVIDRHLTFIISPWLIGDATATIVSLHTRTAFLQLESLPMISNSVLAFTCLFSSRSANNHVLIVNFTIYDDECVFSGWRCLPHLGGCDSTKSQSYANELASDVFLISRVIAKQIQLRVAPNWSSSITCQFEWTPIKHQIKTTLMMSDRTARQQCWQTFARLWCNNIAPIETRLTTTYLGNPNKKYQILINALPLKSLPSRVKHMGKPS